MVVKTRSGNKKKSSNDGTVPCDDRRSLFTPSFREASIWNYKIHTGRRSSGGHVHYRDQEEDDMAALEASATEALVDISDSPSSPSNPEDVMSSHACINPMQPITRYMYRISVYNSERTFHYKTAFILYNHKNRLYYVYTIVSNSYPSDDDDASSASASASASASSSDSLPDSGFPQPVNTIHMKYLSYIGDTIMNYVATLIVPHKDYDYFIQDDILGIVQSNDGAFTASIFGDESSYYDIDRLLHDKTSTETTNGFRVFQLIGSRNYWYDPAAAASEPYTPETLQSVLQILGQSS